MQKETGFGYLRTRKDGIVEWVIGDTESVLRLIEKVVPFLRIKKKQALKMKEILKLKSKVKSPEDFLKLSEMVDDLENLNFSKKRKITSKEVRRYLQKKDLLSP